MQAKKRVYELQQASRSAAMGKNGKRKRVVSKDIADAGTSNEAVEVVPTLEPLPKWELVKEIVQVRFCASPSMLSDFRAVRIGVRA